MDNGTYFRKLWSIGLTSQGYTFHTSTMFLECIQFLLTFSVRFMTLCVFIFSDIGFQVACVIQLCTSQIQLSNKGTPNVHIHFSRRKMSDRYFTSTIGLKLVLFFGYNLMFAFLSHKKGAKLWNFIYSPYKANFGFF